MTLQDLRDLKVTITLNHEFRLGEDVSDEYLSEILEDCDIAEDDIREIIKQTFYSSMDDVMEVAEFEDFKVTIE